MKTKASSLAPRRHARRVLASVAVLTGSVLLAGTATAIEPMVSYDTFTSPTLDPVNWGTLERARGVRSGALNLVQRDAAVPRAVGPKT